MSVRNKIKRSNFYKKHINFIEDSINRIESLFVIFLYYCFSKIPVKCAYSLGYFIGYVILSRLPLQRREEVVKNISMSFPEKSKEEVMKIYRESCGNFVAIIFESPVLDKLINNINVVDKYDMLDFINKNKSIVFTAHIGNWEIYPFPFYKKSFSYPIYKELKNKYINNFLVKKREGNKNSKIKMVSANRQGLSFLNSEMSRNLTTISLPLDQRAKEGIIVNFFGRPVLYSKILQFFAIKYDLPIIPLRVVRKKNSTFDIIIEKPIEFIKTGDKDKDIYEITKVINDKIEGWIKEYPSQWFWLHKRWGKLK